MAARVKRLSAFSRPSMLREMTEEPLDLLIIGGGITGAGIALDAVDRGLRVGLVEKQDFAEGTSSRSTKLIHGGLRYLKQGEIGLVREVGRERAILHRNARHLVIPEKMLLPIVRGGTYGRLATSFGLWLYDRLAGVHRHERRVMLTKAETLAAEPLLAAEGLRGGGLYYEYRTDDARLTMEVLKTAARLGALCVNHAEAVELWYGDGRVAGAIVRDRLTGEHYRVMAKNVVNAAGPWVDELRRADGSLTGKRLHLTKGVHIVVPRTRMPVRQSVYFDVEDGRMVFAIPRGEVTYVGTTDTDYEGPLEEPPVLREDVVYLLRAVNHMFPSVRLGLEDVRSSWAGLRPLIHEDGKSPSELSRKDEIFVSESGLVSIAGGKLTGYRKMAERVVDLVMRELGREEGRAFQPCRTDRIVLSGGDAEEAEMLAHMRRAGPVNDVPGDMDRMLRSLYHKYGAHADIVWTRALEMANSDAREDIHTAVVLAEFEYGVQEEMVTDLNDFLIRRTGRLFFEREEVARWLPNLTRFAAALFGWGPEEVQHQVEKWNQVSCAAVAFKSSGESKDQERPL
ncbi:glycerol-3-phosphate dehydrogenase [Alicyclobacillus macrosporangiidus]|uniref:Glycerol-3-phosphate dehydrogenase n=2 Tax=Alicyclobacillus macrosporangiidus TaxID=392015 RepID=A0A1I7JRJ8_9BACL|nr:glycerol-3-phosphate dehydrogenase/oxidase [Alicyclobacillus macrosporangiidus]SFU87748.1 glycerol-3-phosphate dehydrogenase [Alicyclobacillus macrosporangiidus]